MEVCLISGGPLEFVLIFYVTTHTMKCMGIETQSRDAELQQLLLIHEWQQCGGEKVAPLFLLQNFCIIQAFVEMVLVENANK